MAQRLAHGRQRRILERRALNIVEAHHGNIIRNSASRLSQSAYSPDRGNIIESKQRGERLTGRKQLARYLVPKDGRRRFAFELYDQPFVDFQSQVLRGSLNGLPSHFGIRAELLPLDESDFAVSKVHEMLERQVRRARVIQYDVRYAFDLAVSGDGHHGNRHAFLARGVHRDQALDGPLLQQVGILLDQIGAMPVADNKIKVALLQKVVFNPGHDQRRVSIADFRHHHADRKTSLRAQRASHEIRTVVQLPGSLPDALLGAVRD